MKRLNHQGLHLNQRLLWGGAEKEKQEAEDGREAEAEEAENHRQRWARCLPGQQEWFHGCLIHCVDVAEKEDAIDSSAPVLDHMIVTHLKSRYRMYFVYMHG